MSWKPNARNNEQHIPSTRASVDFDGDADSSDDAEHEVWREQAFYGRRHPTAQPAAAAAAAAVTGGGAGAAGGGAWGASPQANTQATGSTADDWTLSLTLARTPQANGDYAQYLQQSQRASASAQKTDMQKIADELQRGCGVGDRASEEYVFDVPFANTHANATCQRQALENRQKRQALREVLRAVHYPVGQVGLDCQKLDPHGNTWHCRGDARKVTLAATGHAWAFVGAKNEQSILGQLNRGKSVRFEFNTSQGHTAQHHNGDTTTSQQRSIDITVNGQDFVRARNNTRLIYAHGLVSPAEVQDIMLLKQYGRENVQFKHLPPQQSKQDYIDRLMKKVPYVLIRGEAKQYFAKNHGEPFVLPTPRTRILYYATFPQLQRNAPDLYEFCDVDNTGRGRFKSDAAKIAYREKIKVVLRLMIEMAVQNNEYADIVTPVAFFRGLVDENEKTIARNLFFDAVCEVLDEDIQNAQQRQFKGLFIHGAGSTDELARRLNQKPRKQNFTIAPHNCDASAPQRAIQTVLAPGEKCAEGAMGDQGRPAANGALSNECENAKEENDARDMFGFFSTLFNAAWNQRLLETHHYHACRIPFNPVIAEDASSTRARIQRQLQVICQHNLNGVSINLSEHQPFKIILTAPDNDVSKRLVAFLKQHHPELGATWDNRRHQIPILRGPIAKCARTVATRRQQQQHVVLFNPAPQPVPTTAPPTAGAAPHVLVPAPAHPTPPLTTLDSLGALNPAFAQTNVYPGRQNVFVRQIPQQHLEAFEIFLKLNEFPTYRVETDRNNTNVRTVIFEAANRSEAHAKMSRSLAQNNTHGYAIVLQSDIDSALQQRLPKLSNILNIDVDAHLGADGTVTQTAKLHYTDKKAFTECCNVLNLLRQYGLPAKGSTAFTLMHDAKNKQLTVPKAQLHHLLHVLQQLTPARAEAVNALIRDANHGVQAGATTYAGGGGGGGATTATLWPNPQHVQQQHQPQQQQPRPPQPPRF